VQPQVVAHRGSSVDEPEHTLNAYLRAIGDGADALECDVRLTADGHLVCVHDRRVNRTSNGQGRVSTLELAELESLDWGSWKADWADVLDTEQPDRNRGKLLTLRSLLTTVQAAGRPIDLAIETKHPTRYAGQVERTLYKTLREFDLLQFLMRHPDQVFTREQLLDHVWGYTFASDMGTVTVHIRRLREKIERDPANPVFLQTIWGVGYKLGRP
jgi:glycerophosphoryl diester phosphodiesterase